MSSKSFIELMKQYKKVTRLGGTIIKTHKRLKDSYHLNLNSAQIEDIHNRQRKRIESIEALIKKTEKDWKKHSQSIQKYWTGID